MREGGRKEAKREGGKKGRKEGKRSHLGWEAFQHHLCDALEYEHRWSGQYILWFRCVLHHFHFLLLTEAAAQIVSEPHRAGPTE